MENRGEEEELEFEIAEKNETQEPPQAEHLEQAGCTQNNQQQEQDIAPNTSSNIPKKDKTDKGNTDYGSRAQTRITTRVRKSKRRSADSTPEATVIGEEIAGSNTQTSAKNSDNSGSSHLIPRDVKEIANHSIQMHVEGPCTTGHVHLRTAGFST